MNDKLKIWKKYITTTKEEGTAVIADTMWAEDTHTHSLSVNRVGFYALLAGFCQTRPNCKYF